MSAPDTAAVTTDDLAAACDRLLMANLCDTEDDQRGTLDECNCRCHDDVRAARDHAHSLVAAYRQQVRAGG